MNSSDCKAHSYVLEGSPVISGLMFSAGLLGNAAALVLLEVRRRRRRWRRRWSEESARGVPSCCNLFQVLLTALLITDLLGTCSVSPLVIAAYKRNRSLSALGGTDVACTYFAGALTFFSLVTLALLLCMALERCVSISAPYFYQRRVSARGGYLALALIYLSGAPFCLAPLLGVGAYVQYCPGTWCFVDMLSHEHRVYKNLYASCLLVMITCTVLCNVCVSCQLVLMYRRYKLHRVSARRVTEELEHLVLLTFMTFTFLICSLPLVICVFISPISKKQNLHLVGLQLLSMNPILDPWVFILLSPPGPRLLWEAVCKALKPRSLENKVRLSPCTHTRTTSEQQT